MTGGAHLVDSTGTLTFDLAEREYARLFRNVVIEYALLFLRKLEKLGLTRGTGAVQAILR